MSQSYIKRHKKTATEERLHSYNLPPEIEKESLEVLGEIQRKYKTRVFKQRSQDSVIFACVFLAYHRNGIVSDPSFIINFLGLKRENINVDKTLNKYAPGIKVSISGLTAFYIDRYLDLVESSEDRVGIINEVLDFIKKTTVPNEENKNVINWIKTNFLTNVVIGMCTFKLMDLLQKNFSMKKWSSACHLTPSCISKYKKSFEEFYNMD